MTSEKNKGLLVGIITGGVIGGIVALLYAPKSGKEIRKDIKTKSDELMDSATQYYNDAKTRTSEIWDKSLERATDMVSEFKNKATELLSSAKDDVRDTKNTLITTASETIDENSKGRRRRSLSDEAEIRKDALKSGWEEGTSTYKDEKSSRLRK